MSRPIVMAVLLLTLGLPGVVAAHEVRPGYLQITQTGDDTYRLFFKVPGRGDLRLGLYVQLPERCDAGELRRAREVDAAFSDSWSVTCAGGLVGESVRIEGLSGTLTDVLVRFERADGTVQVARLAPEAPAFTVEAVPSTWRIAGTYLTLGIEHILLGIDHLLFVLALLLLVDGWRRVVTTITGFTVAHSITLAAASLGFVNVPQQPVEAVIALSIVFVAAEIVHHRRGRPSLARSQPWLVAFSFGLLHGLGFAGALSEIGLPEHAIPVSLLFFNVGVEIGQLLFIAAVLALGALATRAPVTLRPTRAWKPACAYTIGAVAAFWTLERIMGL